MGASSCRLALVRAHYILGEVEEADTMMKAAGANMLFYTTSSIAAQKARDTKLLEKK